MPPVTGETQCVIADETNTAPAPLGQRYEFLSPASSLSCFAGERVSNKLKKKVSVAEVDLFGATATSVTKKKKKKGRLSDRIRNSISYEIAFVFRYQSVHSGPL